MKVAGGLRAVVASAVACGLATLGVTVAKSEIASSVASMGVADVGACVVVVVCGGGGGVTTAAAAIMAPMESDCLLGSLCLNLQPCPYRH